MELEFFMAMEPPTITAQEHKIVIRNGRPVFYDPPELMTARQKLTDYLALHRPDKKIRGPVELVVTWCFPTPNDRLDSQYKITKPDTDNMIKLLKDCMTKKGFWKDDAQVAYEVLGKFWTTGTEGIYIKAEEAIS